MGRDRFLEAYIDKHPHAKNRIPNGIYAECKRKDNVARAVKLPWQASGEFAELRSVLTDLQTGAFRMANARSTNQDLFLDFEAESAAKREDVCGKALDIPPDKNVNAVARERAAGSIRSAFGIVPKLDARKNGFDAKYEWSRYNNGLDKWKEATAELNKLLPRLQDRAAAEVANLIEDSLKSLDKIK